MIKEVKNTVPWTYFINDLSGEEIIGTFYEIKNKKTTKNKSLGFRIEKVIKRKGNKLYLKWNKYNDLSNSWIHKKDLIE